ncbi:MAG: recombinase family protein [Oscillospiraceae bacterium]|nr:recombinase family protein [Oscillospiraceae bacterium]
MPTVTVIQPTLVESKAKIRAAAYCRVSSSSEDQLNSYMAQVTYYSHKFEDSETEMLVDVYADEGITGTREDKREEFQRLMQDCRRGKIDRIYTKSISRFARNTKDCLKNVRELKSLGITIFFEKESIDTANMTDEMMITIMGGLAQEESVSISQNMRWSIRKRMENGTYRNSTPPFGYVFDGNVLAINPAEAEIVCKIFNWYLSGNGLQTIAEKLNNSEVATCQYGEKWHITTVRYVLTNERYIGDALFQKNYRTEQVPFVKKKNHGEVQMYYANAVNPPIIDKESFWHVQELLASRKREYACNHHFLSRKILCGSCGATYKQRMRSDHECWVCRTRDKDAARCCNPIIPESEIYDAFIRLSNKLTNNVQNILVPLLDALQELKLKKYSGNLQIMDIRKEIAKLREQQHVLTRLKTKGFLNEAKFQTQTAELNTKISRLQRELKRLTQSGDEDETLNQIEMLTDFFAKRQELTVYFEPDAFESIVEKIVVISRNELDFHLIGGLKLTEYVE